MHPFIYLQGKAIPVYGLLLVVAAVIAWLLILLLAKKKRQLEVGDASLTYLIGICGAIVGAVVLRPFMKVFEVAIYWEKYKTVTAEMLLHYLFGEIVFYGGLLGGIVAIFMFCRRYKLNIVHMFDLYAPAVALGHAIGRVGCFFGGCCYGIEVPHGHQLSVIYPPISLGAPPDIPLLAVPLIEAAFLVLLSVILSAVYLKTKKVGICTALYLFLYSIERFILEFYRGDLVRGQYGLFTTSQFISIAFLLFSFICFSRIKKVTL